MTGYPILEFQESLIKSDFMNSNMGIVHIYCFLFTPQVSLLYHPKNVSEKQRLMNLLIIKVIYTTL